MSRYPCASDALAAAARNRWKICIYPAARCSPALCTPVVGYVTHGDWGEFTVAPEPGALPEQAPGWIERIDFACVETRIAHGPLYLAAALDVA